MIYRPEIDGLRAVAVLPVIFFHAGVPLVTGGFVGVDIFFVISGFLITGLISKDLRGGAFSFGKFYERRIRRIFPALFLTLLLSAFLAILLLPPVELVDFGESMIAVVLFLSNFLFWQEIGYFNSQSELMPLLHTWSLSVEEQFYIFYPLFFVLFFRFTKMLLLLLAGLFCVSLLSSWYVTPIHFEGAYYLPFARVWELLLGAAAALWLCAGERDGQGRLHPLFSYLGLGLIGYAVFSFDETTLFPGLSALVPTAGALLIILSRSEENVLHRVLSCRAPVYIGLLSYSLYLFHQPVFAFLRVHGADQVALFLSIGFVCVLSVMSYHFYEKPLRYCSAVSRGRVFLIAASVSVVLILVGAAFVFTEGMPQRYSRDDQKIFAQFREIDEKYVPARFAGLQGAAFGEDRKNVLIVGDSFAQDLLNVAYAADLQKSYSFSTKKIISECGALYRPENVEAFIPDKLKHTCAKAGRFDDRIVRDRLLEADEIWLIGAWKDWVADRLPRTVRLLEEDYQLRVRVFSRKTFGDIDLDKMIGIPPAARSGFRQVATGTVTVNQRLESALPQGRFVNVQDIFCGGSAESCEVFTRDGYLVSLDGGHMTRAGVQKVAPDFRRLVESWTD
ncbi:acyltransferase family protein [Kiloniella sp. b19]|uniref:acyltransferase family protein n=1 Tax=Kiloniella sp. GXU_MW_B19 TaxID=3141326 RepID=UPI0031DDAAA2